MNYVNPKVVSKLYSIFSNNKWKLSDDDEEVFEKYCYLLANLDEKQQELILELSERYTWYTLNECISQMKKLFNSVETSILESANSIIIFPIMKVKDEDVTKSGHALLYHIFPKLSSLNNYPTDKLIKKEKFEDISSNTVSFNSNDYIFLIDDYIGTGKTLKDTILELQLRNNNIKNEQIIVFSIAIQNEAINYLNTQNIKYYNCIISNKGISDFYSGDILPDKINTMKKIEKLIPNKNYCFGYERSEALITLDKTPNNTFPIFWHNYKVGKEEYKAPFARY